VRKTKKQTTTFKRPVGRPRKKTYANGLGKYGEGSVIPGTDKKFKREYPGQDPRIEEPGVPVEDLEESLPEPDDEGSRHKFPPPKKHPIFRKIWMEFIDNISKRENFQNGHLGALEILCDLHVEYEDLRTFIRRNGRSYKSYGRQGMVHKLYPEVGQLNTVQAQIKEYLKTLGLTLKKDHGTTNPAGERNEWE
jgi:hypothetical protein